MLPKKNRADKKAVEKIFKEGKFINSQNLTFKFFYIKENKKMISVFVPKSLVKLAVKRNSLRRVLYTTLKKHLKDFPVGIIGVFLFKKKEDNKITLENEVKNILTKIN